MSEEEYAEVVQQVLKPYQLTSLSIATVSRWLQALGSVYYYFDEVRKEKMVEFHIDASDKLLLWGNTTGTLEVTLV
jgi:hypothetical protein